MDVPQAQGRRRDLPPHALARIEAVLREKKSRTATDRKIDSRLLHEVKRRNGEAELAAPARAATDIRYASDGHLVVDVKAQVTDNLLATLKARGIEVLASDRNRAALRAHVAVDRVRELADIPGVTFVQPQQQAITWRQLQNQLQIALHGSGVARGEGDVTHLAHVTRRAFGVDGTGIKIGVLSDGVNNLAASQASGDLGPVTVVQAQEGFGDEGTAMLEIVHELAPGAQLFFASATTGAGVTSFADNIRTLRFTYDCDIIIDDVFYLQESPFHDGQPAPSQTDMAAVTQAVNDVTADGALYFSSAGNSGHLTAGTSSAWEGDFVDGGAAASLGLPGRLHDFGGQTYNVVVGAGRATTLHWSDAIGGSDNDYDIFAFDETFTILFDASTNLQTGIEDPYESMTSAPGDHVVIVKADGAASRFLHLSGVGAALQVATAGAIQGHAGAANAIAVAATPANRAFPSAFNNTHTVETFSSDGPRRVFYRANGAPYTASLLSGGGLLRPKPDVTAADGVRVTGVGGFPSAFFGTSAAAPHAGAIAALVLAKSPGLTPAQVRTALTSTAIDIGPVAGADRDSGAGIVMADAALRSITSATAALAPVNIYATDGPGDAALLNNRPEAGEGGNFTIELGNFGVSTATGISAFVTSSTPGITVRQQAPSTYVNLATSARALSNVPFFFTVASDFPCPQTASFTLNVNSTAGAQAYTFDVPIGPPSYQFTETLDAIAPAPQVGVSTLTGIQTERLIRTGVPSTCSATPPAPVLFVEDPSNPFPENPNRHFDAYSFNTCVTSVPSCVTVTLTSSNELFSAAYAPAFNQFDVTQNYKGDMGASGGVRSYSFTMPGAGQGFAVDVHQVDGNFGLGDVYSVKVEGACGGTCAPPNRVPVARAKNVTITADATGFATVPLSAINDGSFDPDGDSLTLTLDNPGPYPIGAHNVVLTVSDTRGATSQATAIITVTAQPTISISDVSVTEGDFGTVNASFAITLSNSSTLQVGVSAATAPGTATAPSDFLHNSQALVFQPGEVSKTFIVVVNGDITGEATETFTVNLSSPTNALIADGQAVGTIVNDDVVVTEASVTQAVLTGATRLKSLQRGDGGWYFRVGDTDCRVGAGISCPNTVGITALGLLAGHTRTGDATLLTAAIAAGNYLVARFNATSGAVPPVLPASQDVEFLVELGAKTGDATYTNAATNWFQRIVSNYTAQAYVDRLIAIRGNLPPIGVWNVGSFIRSAKAVANVPGNMAYAEAAALHVTSPAVEALWKDTNFAHRYDQCANPAGCGSPSNPFGYDYTLVAMGTLLNAIHDIPNPALSAKVSEYTTHLLNSQDAEGSWDVGDTQITAYVVLGLASVGAPPSAIENAVNWFLKYQLPNGGWPQYAVGQLLGAEYTELDAEAVRAIFTLYNTPEGQGVTVAPAQFSTLTFSEVTDSGRTSVVATDVPVETTATPGIEVTMLAYDVTTTAVFNGTATVCFAVPSITSPTDFANVRLLQQDGSTLVDRTILGTGDYAPDFDQRRVCGSVTSLRPFAIGMRDTTPPTATVTLSPSVLLANDKNIVSISASIAVSDNTDPSPTVELVSVTSSEADKGLGKRDNPNDIHHAKTGTDDREFGVRAEAFSPSGRVYTATYRVADRYGNSREVRATVTVQPNSRK